MWLLRTERAYAVEAECELRPIDPVEPVDDLVGSPAIDIADEAEGEMVVLHIDPSGARETAT